MSIEPAEVPGRDEAEVSERGFRRLARNTAIYAIADLVAKGGAYLLIPVLTRGLSPSGFGSYTLVVSIVPVLTLVSSLGLGGSVTRMWFDLEPGERKRFHAAAFVWTQGSALVVAGVLSLLAPLLFGAVFPELDAELFLTGVWTAFFLVSTTVPLAVLRAQEQPKRFAVLSGAQFAGPALGVVVALALGAGARGALWGHVAGSSVVFVLSVAFVVPESAKPPAWRAMRPALALGLPVVPHLVAHWALNVADRVAIQRALGAAAVGLYTVGYQVAQGVSLVATAVNNATVPSFYRAAQAGRRDALGRAWPVLLYVLGTFAVGAALFGEELVALLSTPRYHGSAAFIPWVALGYWLLAAYYFPVNALFYAKKVKAIPIATITAAGLNYALNVWLLPERGLIAAAQNTAVAYGVLLAIVLVAAQRIHPIPYRYGATATVGGVGAGIYALSTLLPDGAIGTLAKVPLFAVYLVGGYAVVARHVGALRGAGTAHDVPPDDDEGGRPRVVLAAATATQARTMAACDAALREAGFEPDYVSLDPILGKSAAVGFTDAGVVFREAAGDVAGSMGIVLRGRAEAARLLRGASAVVIGNDFTPFERLLIEQARRAGCASVLVQDGVIALGGDQAGGGARSGSAVTTIAKRMLARAGFPFEPRPYGLGGCDAICVYGPSTRDALIGRGVPADRIVVTGQPRYDRLALAHSDRREGTGHVLVTTQPFSRYGLATLEEETATFAAMIEAALGTGRRVVVKLHPDTDDASREALAGRFGDAAQFEQTIPIEPLLADAVTLVTLSSTTALEALLYRVPVVVVDVPGFPATLPFASSGAVLAAATLADVPRALDDALRAGPDPFAVERFLAEHLAPMDGRAAARVADAVAHAVRCCVRVAGSPG